MRPPPVIQPIPYVIGGVCALATLRTHPSKDRPKGERQRWRLDRITDVQREGPSGTILAVDSGARITRPGDLSGQRATVALGIGGYLGLEFHARECWEAYLAEGRPEWPDGAAAREWVRQHLRRP